MTIVCVCVHTDVWGGSSTVTLPSSPHSYFARIAPWPVEAYFPPVGGSSCNISATKIKHVPLQYNYILYNLTDPVSILACTHGAGKLHLGQPKTYRI